MAARDKLRVQGPLKLPKAPGEYDERDQDRVRRMLEMANKANAHQLVETIEHSGPDLHASNGFRGFGSVLGTNVVDQFVRLQAINPVGSGKVITLHWGQLIQDSNISLWFGVRTTQDIIVNNGATSTIQAEDTRNAPTPTLEFRGTGTAAAIGALPNWDHTLRFNQGAEGYGPLVDFSRVVVLAPGWALDMQHAANAGGAGSNFGLAASLVWTEA